MNTRRKGRETPREEVVNTLLAQALQQQGLPARAERRSREGIPDVRIELPSGLVLLECKWEGSAGLLAAQLDERLAWFPEAIAVVGVLYPERIKLAEDTGACLEAATDLRWRLHGSRGTPAPGSPERSGSVAALIDYLRLLPLELEGLDQVIAAAGVIGAALAKAVVPIRQHRRIAGRIADIITEADKERDRLAALQIGCLVLFNALTFQDRLAGVNPDVPTVPEARKGGLPGIRQAWQGICDRIDYVPVFEIAGSIADVLDDGPVEIQESVFDALIQAMEQTRRVEGHDLSGRLFHTLLTDAKFTGAYYTSVPAATMLARLVFDGWPRGVDWSDHEFPASLNVADLACGTGTLLMAIASEAQRRHESAGGQRALELHKAMVEQALHGFDIQISAIHFAATSLAMLNPQIQFDRMNLYVMPLGVSGEDVSLGSLDFIGTRDAPVQYALSPDTLGVAAQEVERVSGEGRRGVGNVRLPDLDLAIMNPPFTRPGLVLASRPPAERRALQAELTQRLQSRQASATAGLGAAFVVAAAPKLRPGEGRLALVLPATVCTGASWEPTRALIQKDFVLDLVITSHDPQRWNFSDSTDLSEVLLIATRRREGEVSGERRTVFASLWQNPDGVLDAHRMAQAISETTPAPLDGEGTALLNVDGRHVGELVSMPASAVSVSKWFGIQFAHADVLRCAMSLLQNGIVSIPGMGGGGGRSWLPLCQLGDLGQIGPDRRDILDGFEQTQSVTAYPMVAGHKTESRKGLIAEVNKHLAPLVEARPRRRLKSAGQLWQRAGRLLIAERLRLDTTRTVSMCASEPVLSNVWYTVKTDGRDLDKALAIWLNGSLGILTRLAIRTSTEGSWGALKKGELEKLPVLDVRAITPEQRRALSDLFDELSGMEFRRLPDMGECPARRALDDGLSGILGLPDLYILRRMLAVEPAVSNRRVA